MSSQTTRKPKRFTAKGRYRVCVRPTFVGLANFPAIHTAISELDEFAREAGLRLIWNGQFEPQNLFLEGGSADGSGPNFGLRLGIEEIEPGRAKRRQERLLKESKPSEITRRSSDS